MRSFKILPSNTMLSFNKAESQQTRLSTGCGRNFCPFHRKTGGFASCISKLLLGLALVVATACPAWSDTVGSIFLTGQDPDFHAALGANATGAQNFINVGINFVMDPAFNPFVAGGNNTFLFVESNNTPPAGNTFGVNGITASGFSNFDQVNASGLNAALNGLGTTYSAIVIASDFGGNLTQAELDILNSRSADIISFLNQGGGLFAMAESNTTGLTPGGGQFGYLPFVVSSVALGQLESGFTLTPFGASLGLTTSDINGNFSHNIFNGTFGLNIVDQDASGNILTLAARGTVNGGGVSQVPEPATVILLSSGLAGILIRTRRKVA